MRANELIDCEAMIAILDRSNAQSLTQQRTVALFERIVNSLGEDAGVCKLALCRASTILDISNACDIPAWLASSAVGENSYISRSPVTGRLL